ncbi:hypothetical protein [Bacterioplanoides sp. SCSIO 12839]|nr:hypothetical protein [Bacterioplanoides sp. SCSIO 12839]UTW47477.1 hypothetical protein KFF03_12955 [Bacterioplanoides sp. SCSIO 12839]
MLVPQALILDSETPPDPPVLPPPEPPPELPPVPDVPDSISPVLLK